MGGRNERTLLSSRDYGDRHSNETAALLKERSRGKTRREEIIEGSEQKPAPKAHLLEDRMDAYEVVTRLIGPIEPIGETNADERRFENLKVMTELVDSLLIDIHSVSHNTTRAEYSMQRAGKFARDFLVEIGIPE